MPAEPSAKGSRRSLRIGPYAVEAPLTLGSLGSAAVRDVLAQAARGLSRLHREGLVPRDLSADNFRVTRGPDARGRVGVKLFDLGLLRPASDESVGDVRAALGSLGATAWFLL